MTIVSAIPPINTRICPTDAASFQFSYRLKHPISEAVWPDALTVSFKTSQSIFFFFYFADRASQHIYLNINQIEALNFIISLLHASTCSKHVQA